MEAAQRVAAIEWSTGFSRSLVMDQNRLKPVLHCLTLSKPAKAGAPRRCSMAPTLLQRRRARSDFLADHRQERIEGHSIFLCAVATAYGYRVVRHFAIAEDEHVRSLLQLPFAHFRIHALRTEIGFGANAARRQFDL